VTPRPIIHRHAKVAYLTPQAFAEHFAISTMGAYRLLHSGAVKWVRVGRAMRIPISELERFTKAAEGAAYTDVWGDE
jgi:excisionase family DNA binding protein